MSASLTRRSALGVVLVLLASLLPIALPASADEVIVRSGLVDIVDVRNVNGQVRVDTTSDIAAIAAVGITRGCNPPENNLFCPGQPVTRAQMASFLVRTLGLEPTEPDFVDVSANNPHRRDIAALAEAGITRGCNPPANDRFCPTQPATRAQMAAFIHRAAQLGE